MTGRKHQNVEFMVKLRSLSGHFKVTEFAQGCGRTNQVSNFSQYLSGKKIPKDKLLGECLRSLFGWQVTPRLEMQLIPKPLKLVTAEPGVYALYDSNFHLIYVGQATNLCAEIGQALNRKIPGLLGRRIKDRAVYCSVYEIYNARVRTNIEALVIRIVGHQTYNADVEGFAK